MAKKVRTIVTIIDDLTGIELPEGEGKTITYTWKGIAYEIDLSDTNAEQLDELLSPIVRASRRADGRRIGSAGRSRPAVVGSERAAEGRELTPGPDHPNSNIPHTKRAGHAFRREIRSWANQNGFEQARSGRIKEEVVAAWNSAHPDRPFTEGL